MASLKTCRAGCPWCPPQGLQGLVTCYLKAEKYDFDKWLNCCSNPQTVLYHPHQRHLASQVKQQATAILITNGIWKRKHNNFLDILSDVQNSFVGIKGIGDLTIYDVALRIGHSKNIYPNEVYVYQGAKIGAKKLFQQQNKQLSNKTTQIPLQEFAKFFPILLKVSSNKLLTPMYIEDFLCVKKNYL